MKIEQLQKLIADNTTDEGINFESINTAINEETDALIAKKTAKAVETAKATIINEYIKAEGFENEDSFKAHIKNSKAGATELSEKATKLEQQLQESINKIRELENENTSFKYTKRLNEKGIDSKYSDYALFKIQSMVDDDNDFDSVLDEFIKTNEHVLAEKSLPDSRTGAKTKPNGIDDGITAALKRKHPELKLE